MKQRIITAIIGIMIVVPIIIYGSWPFIVTSFVLATIALYELTRMCKLKNYSIYFLIALLFFWLLMLPEQIYVVPIALTKLEIVVGLAVTLLICMVISKNHFTYNDASFFFLSVFYLGFAFHYLIVTRLTGLNIFLFILLIIWATDSGAYFIGRALGKRKLWPEISPNKTIGGALGGISFAIIAAVIFHVIYPFDRSLLFVMMFAIIVSVTGQMGDLVASAIKRNYGVKDYGNLFPGHGGVLDRLDSFLFVLFVIQLFNLY